MRRWLLLILAAIIALFAMTRGDDETAAPGHREPVARAEPRVPTSSAPALPPAATELPRLEGIVLAMDGTPVPGARVTLGDGQATVSELDGSFVFTGLPRGQYSVTAESDGWFGLVQDVQLDEATEPVTIELVLGATLIVRVVDEAGRPIRDANVSVGSRDYKTGADGVARAHAGLWDGRLSMSVTASGYAGRHEPLNLRDNHAVTVEKTVVLASGAEISGIVVDASGARVTDTCVDLVAEELGISQMACPDDDGVWRAPDLGRATYLARASSTSAVPGAPETVAHDGVTPTTGVVVRVIPAAEIAGDVVDGSGTPVIGAVIRATRVSEPADVGETTDVIATTDDAGRFVAPLLPAGRYTVSVTADTLGAVDQVVTLATGQHGRVRFVVVASTIEGVVVDARGQPVEDATIVARSEEPRGYTVAYSDARGRFATGGLPPGRYRVTASRRHSYVDGPSIEVDTGSRGARVVVPDEPKDNS